MKKTLVALAVTAFAASASAVTIYENDGTKVDFNGRIKVALKNDTSDGNKRDLVNDGSRFSFKVDHQVNEQLKALGYAEIRFEADGPSNTFANPNLKRLYTGLDVKDVGTLTFGRQLTNGDAIGLSDFTNAFGGVNQVAGSGNKVIKFTSADFGGFSFGADYYFGNAEKEYKATNFKSDYRNAYDVAVFFKKEVADGVTVKSNAGYSRQHYAIANHPTVNRSAFTLAAGVDVNKFSFGVDYTQAKDSSNTDHLAIFQDKGRGVQDYGISKYAALEVGAAYQILDNLNVYGAYINARGKDADNVKGRVDAFILGTGYNLNKNVRTYVEGATERVKVGSEKAVRENKLAVGFGVFW